jgi:hypothetical protein
MQRHWQGTNWKWRRLPFQCSIKLSAASKIVEHTKDICGLAAPSGVGHPGMAMVDLRDEFAGAKPHSKTSGIAPGSVR